MVNEHYVLDNKNGPGPSTELSKMMLNKASCQITYEGWWYLNLKDTQKNPLNSLRIYSHLEKSYMHENIIHLLQLVVHFQLGKQFSGNKYIEASNLSATIYLK